MRELTAPACQTPRTPTDSAPSAIWQWLIFGALGLLAAGLVLVRQVHFGPGLTPDSSTYVSVARSLVDGEGFVAFYGDLELFPPLFPLVLAVGGVFGVDAIVAAAWVNAGAFGGAVWLVGGWLYRRGAPALLSIGAAAAAALSLPMARVVAYVWSEALFVLLVVLSLSLLDGQMRNGGRRPLLLAAICAALCCLTRYAGFAVVACGVVVLALAGQGAVAMRLRRVVGYAAIALLPIGLWMVRSWVLFGAPVAESEAGRWTSALHALDTASTELLSWILGPSAFWRLAWLWGEGPQPAFAGVGWKLAALGLCGGILAWALGRRPGAWRGVFVPACFLACYFALLALALPLRGLFPEPRYFAPVHLPLILTVALGVNAMLEGGPERSASRGRRLLIVAVAGVGVALWLAQWANAQRIDIGQWLARGSDGYGARRWRNSETVLHLRTAGLPGNRIFTNDHAAVYLLAGLGPDGARLFTHGQCGVDETCLFNVANDAALSRYRGADSGAHIAWFHRPHLERRIAFATMLDAHSPLNVSAVLADGVVLHAGHENTPADAAAEIAAVLLPDPDDRVLTPSRWDWYQILSGRQLTYVRPNCARADAQTPFFLEVVPQDPRLLPRDTRFENLGFEFADRGIVHNGTCLATAQLPDYAIADVRTGQRQAERELWRARFTPPRDNRQP